MIPYCHLIQKIHGVAYERRSHSCKAAYKRLPNGRSHHARPAGYKSLSFIWASGVTTLVAAEVLSLSVTAENNRTAEAEAVTGFMSEQPDVGLSAIATVISVGAGFVVFNSSSISVTQRHADFGRLQAGGMTRSQLVGMLHSEARLLGLAGSGLGLWPGLFSILKTPWLTAFSARVPASRMVKGAVVGMLGQQQDLA